LKAALRTGRKSKGPSSAATVAACVIDAALTLYLVRRGCAEVNPVMAHLLRRGVHWFLIGKYLLTALGLPVLLIVKNHYLFGTRFRAEYILVIAVFLYAVLIAYQLSLVGAL